LIADSEIFVDNGGEIAKAEINADGVVMDGDGPLEIEVADTVTEGPVDSDGNAVEGASPGGAPAGGGGSLPEAA
jgi:hypothetical protein